MTGGVRAMEIRSPIAAVIAKLFPGPTASSQSARPAADLTAGLLRSTPSVPQHSRVSAASPFFGKGEATADHFRPRQPTLSVPAAPQPAAAEARGRRLEGLAPPRDARLWLRVVPALRWRMKLAAAVLGQTCQRFLVDALDEAMARGLTVADDPAATPPRSTVEPRVKLAFWVDHGRRTSMRLATAARNETQQAFLHAALAAHLRRFAPSGLLLQAEDGGGAAIFAFPSPATEPESALRNAS
jgi:hypothetical protein